MSWQCGWCEFVNTDGVNHCARCSVYVGGIETISVSVVDWKARAERAEARITELEVAIRKHRNQLSMNIYIASRWSRQSALRQIRDEIHKNPKLRVVSRWIDAARPENPDEKFFLSRDGEQRAKNDFDDIRASDLVVADMLDGFGRRGGMLIEIGYARGLNKPVVLIGNRADFGVFGNIFALSFTDWKTAIENF